jgi:hypothetical protein
MERRYSAGGTRRDYWLAAAVLTHLVITFVHGAAHRGAAVPLGPVAALFVLLVIEVGPVLGLMLSRSRPVLGGWTVAATMAGALIFGFVNHFLLISPDHVSHVLADWRPLFTTSAVLLVVSELAGVVAGWRHATRPMEVRP